MNTNELIALAFTNGRFSILSTDALFLHIRSIVYRDYDICDSVDIEECIYYLIDDQCDSIFSSQEKLWLLID